jgi:hypothetical protein
MQIVIHHPYYEGMKEETIDCLLCETVDGVTYQIGKIKIKSDRWKTFKDEMIAKGISFSPAFN